MGFTLTAEIFKICFIPHDWLIIQNPFQLHKNKLKPQTDPKTKLICAQRVQV